MRSHRKMTPQEKVKWVGVKGRFKDNQVHDPELLIIAELFSKVFGTKFVLPCRSCPKTWKAWINMLNKVAEE